MMRVLEILKRATNRDKPLMRVLEKLEGAANRAKPLVEIAAIILAGWWTYNLFIRTEEPALKDNFRFESVLIWHQSEGKSSCVAEGCSSPPCLRRFPSSCPLVI